MLRPVLLAVLCILPLPMLMTRTAIAQDDRFAPATQTAAADNPSGGSAVPAKAKPVAPLALPPPFRMPDPQRSHPRVPGTAAQIPPRNSR